MYIALFTKSTTNNRVVFLCLVDSSPFMLAEHVFPPNYEILRVQDSGAKEERGGLYIWAICIKLQLLWEQVAFHS